MKTKAHRHDSTHTSIGGYISHKIESNRVLINCTNAQLCVTIYSDTIIRIQAQQNNKAFEDFSYAIAILPTGIKFEFEDQADKLIIQTSKIILEILKHPLRLRFFDRDGSLLNEDDPAFGISWAGAEVTCYKKLQEGERFIGLGEKTGNLDRRGSYYMHWNTDYFAYPTDGDPLYISTPFYIGVHSRKCYGIFFDSSYKTIVDFGASNKRFSYFQAPNGEMNYYFIFGNTVTELISSYTLLTGRMPLPPRWSLGFQQCRYSYYPEHEVLSLAKNFRDRDIPCDVIYLDIHYMDAYKVFTWDKMRFPLPSKMIAHLKEMGFQVVLIIDPGIKIDKDYPLYKEGTENNFFITYPDGEPYAGGVWPGDCHFPDFTNPAVRQWWGKLYKEHIDEGVEGFWNDMNEPSAWGRHIPDLVEFAYDGETASHRKAHNIYGMQMAHSTYDGVRKQLSNKRPFVLTRSGYSGIQRYAAAWTGDNVSSDEHLMAGVRLLNSMGLAGMAFCGNDIGGFAGEASPALFARWVAVGAFSPLFRAHSMINSRDAEPWAFGEETEDIARNYIKLRYRLLPYIYSTFYRAAQTGLPVQRSLSIDYTYDPNIYKTNFQNQYLFGPAFLVCPVESYKDVTTVYLPEGDWNYLHTDKLYEGQQEHFVKCNLEMLPVFVKAGSIVPMQSDVVHANQLPSNKTLHLHVYEGSHETSFEYYEDDGATFDYEKSGYYKRMIKFTPKGRLLFDKVEGTFTSRFSIVRIYCHGFANVKPMYNHKALTIQHTDYSFLNPVSHFDPFMQEKENHAHVRNLPFIDLEWKADPFEVILSH